MCALGFQFDCHQRARGRIPAALCPQIVKEPDESCSVVDFGGAGLKDHSEAVLILPNHLDLMLIGRVVQEGLTEIGHDIQNSGAFGIGIRRDNRIDIKVDQRPERTGNLRRVEEVG